MAGANGVQVVVLAVIVDNAKAAVSVEVVLSEDVSQVHLKKPAVLILLVDASFHLLNNQVHSLALEGALEEVHRAVFVLDANG